MLNRHARHSGILYSRTALVIALLIAAVPVAAQQSPPTITSLQPSSVVAGSPDFTLQVNGTGFTKMDPPTGPYYNYTCPSVVLWNQTALNYTFVSSMQLMATVPKALVQSPGTAQVTVVNQTVQNMYFCSSSGPTSNPETFTITQPIQPPIIDKISPDLATACGPQFTLAATGSYFQPTTRLGWGGSDQLYVPLTTNYLSAQQVSALITADRIASVQQVWVIAANSVSGQDVFGSPVPFTINPTPLASTVNPASVVAGSGSTTLTLTGSNFLPVTRVRWISGNASQLLSPSNFTQTQLSVQVPASLLATAGSAQVSAVNANLANPSGTAYPAGCAPPVTVTIVPALTISTSSPLPPATAGTAYSQTIAATGGKPPYKWSLVSVSPSTPQWLSIDASSGVLAGTATAAGSFTATVRATDASNPTLQDTRSFAITMNPPDLKITTTSLPAGTAGTAYSATVQAAGGTPGYTWSILSVTPATPDWLTVNAAAGTLGGNPPAAGDYTVNLQVTDSSNPAKKDSRSFTIRVNAAELRITTTSLPAATAGTGYSQTLKAAGGIPGYQWSLVSVIPTTPTWITVSQDGTITGTPPAPNSYSVAVRVTDVASKTAQQTFTITVSLPQLPTISLTSTPVTAPTDQPRISLKFSDGYPLDLIGRISLSFTPNAAGLPAGYIDPAVQFAGGGRTLAVSIPRNATDVSLPNNGAFALGTVAGTVTVALDQLQMSSGGTVPLPANAPSTSSTVPRAAPVITANSVRITNVTSTGFTIDIGSAYSTTRDLTDNAVVTFTPAAGAQLDGTRFTMALATPSANWFSSTAGRDQGSRFSVQIPFSYSGDTSAVGTVSVTLENSAGTSAAVSGGKQ